MSTSLVYMYIPMRICMYVHAHCMHIHMYMHIACTYVCTSCVHMYVHAMYIHKYNCDRVLALRLTPTEKD